MPVTRRQAAHGQQKEEMPVIPTSRAKKGAPKKQAQEKELPTVGEKHEAEEDKVSKDEEEDQPPTKKAKTEDEEPQAQAEPDAEAKKDHPSKHSYQSGTIERGHIYFFYRPRVELEEAQSIEDVQRFHILLIPRPPEFSAASGQQNSPNDADGEKENEMSLLSHGADAVPAAEPTDQNKKRFRLLVVGKKSLPDPEATGEGKGSGRNQVFWSTITTVGEDLKKLQDGLGPKEYETKTRGTRHQGAARLAARGAYAVVNTEASMPSKRETHLGYHLSHPTFEHFGEVQEELGIHPASSFVIQVKNPLGPLTGPGRIGLPKSRRVDYPEEIMSNVFGKGGKRGREDFGLRFASVERKDLLDYEGVELLFIAARSGEEGLERSLGDGRGIGK
ncbi:hypothetical protein AcW1_001252 [Taiwanofungus camphoratus]|nr:hypothetical protein AcV5_005163 [Antrodia cinnamomea]KAI0962423.1 hypothetical protein AcV7_001267 [Antrodia cinnamomea]KAI0964432.1 hypothetical protein AcW1_001252 [Antrodia cinnamomea]